MANIPPNGMLTITQKQQSRKQGRGKVSIMNIPLTHQDCNGWVILDKSCIIATNPRNYHVAEARITTNPNGTRSYALNAKKETCCSKLRAIAPTYNVPCFYQHEVNALRTKLAELENKSFETCGNCVGHFYADPEV